MDIFLLLLLGFGLGFILMSIFRLGQGKMARCPQCGKSYWVSNKKSDPECKKCGVRLKIEKTSAGGASRSTNSSGRKKKPDR